MYVCVRHCSLPPYIDPFIVTPLDSWVQQPDRYLLPFELLIALSIPCNSWLFFLRIRAIYGHSKITMILVSLFWTLTFTSFLFFAGFHAITVSQPGSSCPIAKHYEVHPNLISLPFIFLALFDTSVIIATMCWLVNNDGARPWKDRIQSIVLADPFGRVSQLFIRSGQMYYLSVILPFSRFIYNWVVTTQNHHRHPYIHRHHWSICCGEAPCTSPNSPSCLCSP